MNTTIGKIIIFVFLIGYGSAVGLTANMAVRARLTVAAATLGPVLAGQDSHLVESGTLDAPRFAEVFARYQAKPRTRPFWVNIDGEKYWAMVHGDKAAMVADPALDDETGKRRSSLVYTAFGIMIIGMIGMKWLGGLFYRKGESAE